MNEIKIKFKTKKAEEDFKDLVEYVLGIVIDGSGEKHVDNYGQLHYTSQSKEELIVESN